MSDPILDANDLALALAEVRQQGSSLQARAVYDSHEALRVENDRLRGEVQKLDRALSDVSKMAHDAGMEVDLLRRRNQSGRSVAYDVIRRLLDGWTVIRTVAPWGREWHGPDGELEAVSAAHAAALDAVAGPNAPPKLDLGGSAECVECDSPHRFGERCATGPNDPQPCPYAFGDIWPCVLQAGHDGKHSADENHRDLVSALDDLAGPNDTEENPDDA